MDAFQRWLGRRALSPDEIALNQGGASPSENLEFDITLFDFVDDRLDLGRDHYIAPLASNTPPFTCNACHENGGGTPGGLFEATLGGGSNTNDATQIDDTNDDLGLDLLGFALPKDLGGDGAIGSGTGDEDPADPDGDSAFSFMPVIEATVKKSFFHNGLKKGSIEDAIEFYFSDDFLATRNVDLDNDGILDLVLACDEDCMRFGGGDLAFPDGDGVEHLGAFIRILASYYKLRDCERLVSEVKQRIGLKAPTDLPVRHCIFNLEDVKRLVRGAKLEPKPNQKLVAQAARLIPRLQTAAAAKDQFELDGILSYLASMKEGIARFPASDQLAANQ
jgi:hypothetical protein